VQYFVSITHNDRFGFVSIISKVNFHISKISKYVILPRSYRYADMVSMARPLLADPHFVRKAINQKADEINTCIGCNQACLDHIFVGKKASCLVNPLAANETSLKITPVAKDKVQNIAVVGAGPAGLAFATTAANRGHKVTLFEKDKEIGGQFNMAKKIPGKEEFYETLRYFGKQLTLSGVNVRLGHEATASDLNGFDSVVIATGVVPRNIKLLDTSNAKVKVLSYLDVLKGNAPVGDRVAVLGAGGIGFDVSEFLTHNAAHAVQVPLKNEIDSEAVRDFMRSWNIDDSISVPGGLKKVPVDASPKRKVYLLQRKEGKVGSTLGKTTGWIHRSTLKKQNVEELSGCKYLGVTPEGLLIERNGVKSTLAVDSVVLCTGQEPLRALQEAAIKASKKVFLIGGAQEAGDLDAKRAIDQGTRLAATVESASSGQVFESPPEFNHKVKTFGDGIVKKFMKA
jgi:2,4-dienoyl-CoA reductase (NADPH2)